MVLCQTWAGNYDFVVVIAKPEGVSLMDGHWKLMFADMRVGHDNHILMGSCLDDLKLMETPLYQLGTMLMGHAILIKSIPNLKLIATQYESGIHVTPFSEATYVGQFMRLNPSIFTGVKVDKDALGFLYEMEKIFCVLHATNMKGVEFVTYQLKDMAYQWFGNQNHGKTHNLRSLGGTLPCQGDVFRWKIQVAFVRRRISLENSRNICKETHFLVWGIPEEKCIYLPGNALTYPVFEGVVMVDIMVTVMMVTVDSGGCGCGCDGTLLDVSSWSFPSFKKSSSIFVHKNSITEVGFSWGRRKFYGSTPNAKKKKHSKKKSWWRKFFLEDDGNWLGLKDEDMLDGLESEGLGSDDDELSENEKFEAWKRRAEAIMELREAQAGIKNDENKRWEDWLVDGTVDFGNGSSWVQGDSEDSMQEDPSDLIPGRGLVKSVRDMVLGKEEDDMLYEDRIFQYASFNSLLELPNIASAMCSLRFSLGAVVLFLLQAKFLAVLIIVPWALDFVVHDYVLMPFLDRYVKTVPLAAQMLDVRRNQKLEMVKELKTEQARYRLEVEIGKSPHLSEKELYLELRHKAQEDLSILEGKSTYLWQSYSSLSSSLARFSATDWVGESATDCPTLGFVFSLGKIWLRGPRKKQPAVKISRTGC
ncbi:putative RNA pseudouridine synthase 3, mitochondrial-like isoform X1 [Capsicum annuum]|nr:putative RNA pseudouridine synthase 3, mitochondrial-like isoform X1 [Capsicum annuum]